MKSPWLWLLLLIFLSTIYAVAIDATFPWFGLTDTLNQRIGEKGGLAALLVLLTVMIGRVRQSGLVARMRWSTLALYWPMALIAGLIWAGPKADVDADTLVRLGLLVLAVGIAEELMFRGLVFDWFRDLSTRRIIVISAGAFGGVHLTGLLSDIHPAVIVAQGYLAFAFGLIFAAARARDVSIVIPIFVHTVFDWLALAPKGGIEASFSDVGQTVAGMLIAGTIALAWGLWLWHRSVGNHAEVWREDIAGDAGIGAHAT